MLPLCEPPISCLLPLLLPAGAKEGFFSQLVDAVADHMGDAYPELHRARAQIRCVPAECQSRLVLCLSGASLAAEGCCSAGMPLGARIARKGAPSPPMCWRGVAEPCAQMRLDLQRRKCVQSHHRRHGPRSLPLSLSWPTYSRLPIIATSACREIIADDEATCSRFLFLPPALLTSLQWLNDDPRREIVADEEATFSRSCSFPAHTD